MARTYLERKEAWAAKMRSLPARTERVEGRLPPGQHTVKELPVLDLAFTRRWSTRIGDWRSAAWLSHPWHWIGTH
jgi:hypothetical protein